MPFNIFGRKSLHLVIDNGRVGCPVRNCDVEFDLCAGCRWVRDIDEKADIPFVSCRPEFPLTDVLRY